MEKPVLIYVWWLFVNGIMYYGVFDFLLSAAKSQGKGYIPRVCEIISVN